MTVYIFNMQLFQTTSNQFCVSVFASYGIVLVILEPDKVTKKGLMDQVQYID